MSKTILVFGASGTVGQGLIKVSLERANTKVVGFFRSEESAKKTIVRLGNPPEDKFVHIVGSVATEQDGADLLKRVLEKVGSYTDVLIAIGTFSMKTPILEQSLDELRKVVFTDKLEPMFVIAKYFLTHIQDTPGTSYTIINGGLANKTHPKVGHLTVAKGTVLKLAQVIMTELKDKPVRINEVLISCYVIPWDKHTPPTGLNVPHTNNVEMGKALLGVIVHPNSKGVSMTISIEHLSKLATEGTA